MTLVLSDRFVKDLPSAAPLPAARPAVEPLLLGRQTPGHIPALDGLRGIAVLLVLFCHATQRPFGELANDAFTGGVNRAVLAAARLSWTGVDLFFVISGFLITGILFDAKGKSNFFRNFYARRTVRIFPLYYACLVLYLLVFPMFPWLNQGMGVIETKSTAWYWLYLSNYSQAITEQWGHPTHALVQVSWTLSIEEQFYLCWPLVVFLFERKTLLKICGLMFFGSMMLRTAFMLKGNIYWAMGFTPCRVDSLAVGAFVALIARGPRGIRSLLPAAKWLLPTTAILLFGLVTWMKRLGYTQGTGQSPGYAMVGTALFALLYGSCLLFAVTAAQDSRLHSLFTAKIFRIFGKYSYGVYLFHMPIIVLMYQHGLFDPRQFHGRALLPAMLAFYAITWTLSLGVAIISWNVMEKHFLKLKALFPMHAQAPAGAVTRI